jgi:kinesin family protein 6/9
MGDTHNYEHRGLAPRAVSQVFNEVNSRVEYEYKVSCTYLELYGEKIFDLLTDLSQTNQSGEFTIAEEKDGRGIHVRGLQEIEVSNENEALNLLFSGELAKTTAQHKLNRKSNRSHSIFTIYLQQRQRSGISERVVHSKLHLVDLAGSERLKKTQDAPDGSIGDEVTRKESMTINQSLTYLEQCVVALSKKGSIGHVPYRQCKLTTILKDALGANCNTLMMACIWGEQQHLEESVSTLRLASRMMRVQNETSKVETIDSSTLIRKQAKLIKALKQELLMHDALVERTGVGYEPYTPEQQMSIRQMLENYVDVAEVDEDDSLQIDSYRKMLEICKQFKKMVLQARDDVRLAKEEGSGSLEFGNTKTLNGNEFSTGEYMADSKSLGNTGAGVAVQYVGDDDDFGSGFSIGAAPHDSLPHASSGGNHISFSSDAKGASDRPKVLNGKKAASSSHKVDFATESSNPSLATRDRIDIPDAKSGKAIDIFIRGEGAELQERLNKSKATLRDLRSRSRDLSQSVNSFKVKIDELQRDIESRKNSRIALLKGSGFKASETEDIIDEEEFNLMKDLKEAKRSYKNSYEQLQKVNNVMSQSQLLTDKYKDEFAEEFAIWETKYRFTADAFGSRSKNEDDQLDDQEEFERLEVERVMQKDPDSLAFFHAQKTRKAHMTQNGSNIKQIHKTKRLG